jgi:hypothetical protein
MKMNNSAKRRLRKAIRRGAADELARAKGTSRTRRPIGAYLVGVAAVREFRGRGVAMPPAALAKIEKIVLAKARR